jgi:hypothetical protein
MGERLAQRRLGDVENLGGACQAVLAQQNLEDLEMMEIELARIT